MDTENTSAEAPKAEMPLHDVMYVEVPAGGFTGEQIQKYIRNGYFLWGIVPMESQTQSTGLITPSGRQMEITDHLVLKMDVNAIPVNVLAHHLVKARNDKGGLNQIAETFFGLSIGGLDKGLQEARSKSNGR